jgi:two-component system, cell cycle response regulator
MNGAASSILHHSAENKVRILVAEDDLTARNILTGVLRKWGYEVIAVKDGQAAWDILQLPDSPHLVILDWMMPGIDGLEVIRRTRAQFVDQPPYIILLTSKDERGDILSGLETGANDYIKKPFDQEELYARIGVGQRTVELQANLYETKQTLAHLATHDPLTGILNRRAIMEQLSKELSRSLRNGHCTNCAWLSIGYFDIDHFKYINDHFGHQSGDEVLKAISKILADHMRNYDSFGRLGGDEFLVIAPGASEEISMDLFARIVTSIAGHKILLGSEKVSVTVSIGVASIHSEIGIDELLDIADAAMYRAKREGGNRVIVGQ